MINQKIVLLQDSMFMSQWQKLVRTHPKYTNSNNTPSNVYDINHFYNWIKAYDRTSYYAHIFLLIKSKGALSDFNRDLPINI